MSKIVAIIASPRKSGNCVSIVDKMAEVAKAAGNDVEVFSVNMLDYKGCQACMGCKKAGQGCIRKDGLTPVLEAIKACDGIILATPDYFGQAVSQYRMLEDRFYGYVGAGPNGFVCNIPEGKKVATVVTSGSGAGAENIAATIKNVLGGFLKCDVVGNIDYREGPNGPAKDNADVMEEAVALAKKL